MPPHYSVLVIVVSVDEYDHIASRVDLVVCGSVSPVTYLLEPDTPIDPVIRPWISIIPDSEIYRLSRLTLESAPPHAPGADDIGAVERLVLHWLQPPDFHV